MGHTTIKQILLGGALAVLAHSAMAQGTDNKASGTSPEPKASSAASAVEQAPEQFTTLETDRTYRRALQRWLADAPGKKWKLSWELEDDYSFTYESEFGTDLVTAVSELCRALNSSGIRARAYFYQGNRVIRIVPEGSPR